MRCEQPHGKTEFMQTTELAYASPATAFEDSGGERQRISLARAFLKDAPILILDEPTSSVDMKTEAVIMEAMTRLMHQRTTFMIAHRLSTLTHCDVRMQVEVGRVIELEQQRIVGEGADGNVAESLHKSKEIP